MGDEEAKVAASCLVSSWGGTQAANPGWKVEGGQRGPRGSSAEWAGSCLKPCGRAPPGHGSPGGQTPGQGFESRMSPGAVCKPHTFQARESGPKNDEIGVESRRIWDFCL